MSHHSRYKEVQRLVDRLADRAPAAMASSEALAETASAEGALCMRTKALIALAVTITSHAEASVPVQVYDALEAGASLQEIVDTIGVAVRMGGEPALVCGAQALGAAEELLAVVEPAAAS